MRLPKGTYKAIRSYLAKGNTPEETADILGETEDLFNRFIDEAPAPGGMNFLRKQYYGGLSIFAFYEAMQGNVRDDDLQVILWSMLLGGGTIDRRTPIPVRLEGGALQKLAYAAVARYARFVNRKVDSGQWNNAWKIGVNPYGRKNGLCVPLYSCPVARFAKAHGYEHLMPLFCGSDFKVAEKYGMKLIRTHTEAEGYSDCDFWYLNANSVEE